MTPAMAVSVRPKSSAAVPPRRLLTVNGLAPVVRSVSSIRSPSALMAADSRAGRRH